jgi:hypothetical protein
MKPKNLLTAVAICCTAFVSLSSYAYLDPNIGSMLIQGIVAGIAVVTVTLRMYWYRLVAFFKGEKVEQEEDLLADLNSPSSNLNTETEDEAK